MHDDNDDKIVHSHYYNPDPTHTHEDHDHGYEIEGPIEEHPLWQRDNVTLWSVGIDIGSAGTQVLFARMHLRRQAVDLSSRFLVVSRDTWYESPVSLTPYLDENRIDDQALGAIIDKAYTEANMHPDDIDTGVVILTGEALRRENSQRIGFILSEKCGELVCVTAGHHMEAMLAAHGSGAAQASHDRGEKVINIDIGGGTTKLSVIEGGKVLCTAAIHIGGRLITVDDNQRIDHIDPAGRTHAARAGFTWKVGDEATPEQFDRVAESMVNDLVAALTQPSPPADVMDLYLTDPVTDLDGIRSMVFSGGVAEFIYEREEQDFGDLGQYLGKQIRARVSSGDLPWELLPDSKGIRSTVLGASEYTAQLSGNTGYISDPKVLLPRRNLQVLHPDYDFSQTIDPEELAEVIRQHIVTFDVEGTDDDLVFAFHWEGTPEFPRIQAFAEGIRHGLAERLQRGKPLYLILDSDIAMNLGAVLAEHPDIDNEIMVIDGVALWDFDFIDLGRLRMPSATVPVTIKSLVFQDISQGPQRHERIHHQTQAAEPLRGI